MTKQPEFNSRHPLTYFDALQILHIVKSTEKCESVRLCFGGMKISLERVSTDQGVRLEESPPIVEPGAPALAVRSSETAVEADSALGATAGEEDDITAPMVGFFHRCSGCGETLNVQVGDMVQATDTIGIVKAMGISKPIMAGVSGRVTEIPVADADFVEYGQPVLRVKRTGQ